MRLIYYGTKLSDNLSRREPEGYLFCLNVPVARSGTQEYLPEELGLPPGRTLIPVFRPEEEVFSPACMASFEGMPVTDGHPSDPEGVNAENSRFLQRGHAHNIRRGTGKESDLLLADLIVTDPMLISRILEGGRREISCGYNYELTEENGRYVQRQIRGNHVAVVEAGRAGHRVCIKDHKVEERRSPMEKMNRKLVRVLAGMAKDGDTEAAELLAGLLEPEAAAEAGTEKEEKAETAEEAVEVSVPGDQPVLIDCGEQIVTLLKQIVTLLAPEAAAPAADEAEEPAAEPDAPEKEAPEGTDGVLIAAEEPREADPVAEVIEELLDLPAEGPSDVIGPEENDCADPDRRTADAVRAAILAVRPAVAQLPGSQRKKVTADLARRLRALSGRPEAASDAYAALSRASVKREEDPAALGRQIMAERNVNYRK